MEYCDEIFGSGGNELLWWQMAARAALVFILCIPLLRISGRRSFSLRSSFDNCTAILLGAILSRAVTGASPFFPTLSASLVLVLLHRVLSWVCVHNRFLNRFANGKPILLYKQGKIIHENLEKGLVSEEDILEGMRLQRKSDSFHNVDSIYLERSGDISVVEKQ